MPHPKHPAHSHATSLVAPIHLLAGGTYRYSDLHRAIDTIVIAKVKFPGARYSLDELCRRFGIDLSDRSKHGALLDAELLAKVYLELLGGRQKTLGLAPSSITLNEDTGAARQRPVPLAPLITALELAAHTAFVAKELGDAALWAKIVTPAGL